MKKVHSKDKRTVSNCSAFSSSVNQSLPDEEMIKKFYSTNRESPPVAASEDHK